MNTSESYLYGQVVSTKQQRLLLHNLDELDADLIERYATNPAGMRTEATEAAYGVMLQPAYSHIIDEAVRLNPSTVPQKLPGHHSLYVPVIPTQMSEAFIAALADPDVAMQLADDLALALRRAVNAKSFTPGAEVPVFGALRDPAYAEALANEVVALLNPLNDPLSAMGPEIYRDIASDYANLVKI